ncbi:MAG TPA: hypothetical protein VGE00_02950 [Gammaproteobacteria bacterium]
MDNHYAPPKAQLTELTNTTTRWGVLFWLVAIGATLLSIGLGLFGFFAVPQFAELFAGFGAELPWQTVIVLKLSHGLWLPSVAALLVWMKWFGAERDSHSRKRLITLFAAIGLTVIVIMALVISTLYLPIFTTGELVK